MKLKIMEWNINQRLNYAGVDIPDWISEVILEKKADIIALTEVYRGDNWECIKKKSFNSNYAVFESCHTLTGLLSAQMAPAMKAEYFSPSS